MQQLVRQDPAIYCLVVSLRPDHCWRLVSYPTLLNEIGPDDKPTKSIVHLAVPVNDKAAGGEVGVFEGDKAGEIDKNRRNILPSLVAVEDDLEAVEWGQHSASKLAQSHRLLTTPGETISTRFPATVELTSLGALSDALIGRGS